MIRSPDRQFSPVVLRLSVLVMTLLVALPPTGVAAQTADRDALLNCFYTARESNPNTARACLTQVLDAQPDDVQALVELGYFELGQQQDAAAIDAFNRAVAAGTARADVRAQLGYLQLARNDRAQALESFMAALTLEPANEPLQMQAAYLLDELGRDREAKRLFDTVERQTRDDARRRQACAASETLAPLATHRLPPPYYVEVYTAPDWYSNIDVATLPLRLRAGVAFGPGDRIQLFGQSATLADNRSDAAGQPGPVIYFDNVELLGGGVSVQPFARVGLTIGGVVGAAYDLIDQQRDRWRFDARAGLEYYGAWEYASRCPSGLSTPFRPVFEAYGSSVYFSRYDDLISSVRFRPGLRVLETSRVSLDAHLHLAGIVDTTGQEYNNLFEIGGGAILAPDRRVGLRLGFETLQRRFRGGHRDVVTRVRIEYAARF